MKYLRLFGVGLLVLGAVSCDVNAMWGSEQTEEQRLNSEIRKELEEKRVSVDVIVERMQTMKDSGLKLDYEVELELYRSENEDIKKYLDEYRSIKKKNLKIPDERYTRFTSEPSGIIKNRKLLEFLLNNKESFAKEFAEEFNKMRAQVNNSGDKILPVVGVALYRIGQDRLAKKCFYR